MAVVDEWLWAGHWPKEGMDRAAITNIGTRKSDKRAQKYSHIIIDRHSFAEVFQITQHWALDKSLCVHM